MTRRYLVDFQVNRSMPTFCQGNCGNGVDSNGSTGWQPNLQQILHDRTVSVICLPSPGHQTEALALSRHLVIPWCPVCRQLKISCLIKFGMISLDPLRSRPSRTCSSEATGKYCLTGPVTLSGQPDSQYCINCWLTSSCFKHCLI